ncbi:ASCH domain-containing protein [Comamonas sp. Z1]|uniref:ASCH domain-containing protein n=1 Tax=Comamonas sp. Z1 TaxID=2601246 RepID=UPI00351AEC77
MSDIQGAPVRLPVLTLPLKGEYFEAIRDGSKHEEYRLAKPYWSKRLEGRSYAQIVLTLGYPAADDHESRLVLPWRGYTRKTITHPHFGPDPVDVYAIDVSARSQSAQQS